MSSYLNASPRVCLDELSNKPVTMYIVCTQTFSILRLQNQTETAKERSSFQRFELCQSIRNQKTIISA